MSYVQDLTKIDLKLLNRQQDLMNELICKGELTDNECGMLDGLNCAIDALRNAVHEIKNNG